MDVDSLGLNTSFLPNAFFRKFKGKFDENISKKF